MKSATNIVNVTIHIPDAVRESLREIHVLAEKNDSVRSLVREWTSGDNGPVLVAQRLKRAPATGTYHATLEFTKRFAGFLAAWCPKVPDDSCEELLNYIADLLHAHSIAAGETNCGDPLFDSNGKWASADAMRLLARHGKMHVIPATLIASELFGHEKGSFTGAVARRQGRFREAEGGTLFLDEIGDMPLELQPALLRAIEHGIFTPVGGDKEVQVDYRLIAATNRNLMEDVKKGRFREDLYYRLNVIAVELPPLRDRPEDVLPLARHFLSKDQSESKRLSRAAGQIVAAYSWPGNVRELANAMEHARLLSQTDVILPEHLPPVVRQATTRPAATADETESPGMTRGVKTLEANEIEMVRRALEQTGGNRTKAAELLGITRRGLIYKLKRLGL